MTTISTLELPRHLEGTDVTWAKLQKSSGGLLDRPPLLRGGRERARLA